MKKPRFTKTYNIKECGLSMIDNLVYATLHTYRNNVTYKCNPTMDQLSEKLKLSTYTIKESIDNLEAAGFVYIEQTTQGNKTNNYYYLPDIKDFTKIPPDFIESDKYKAKLKAYTIAFRNLFFNDSLKCKYNNTTIAKMLGLDKRTSDKYIKQMINNDLLDMDNKEYTLNDAIVDWRLTRLEAAVECNTLDIDQLKKELQELKATNEKRESEIDELKALVYMQLKGQKKEKKEKQVIIL